MPKQSEAERQERIRAAKQRYRQSEKGKQTQARYYAENRTRHLTQSRKTNLRQYDSTPEEYEKQLAEQDYRCAICKILATECTRRLAVDHCHLTNTKRGLLCFRCNASIGKFGDSVELLEAAISYLRRYQHAKAV